MKIKIKGYFKVIQVSFDKIISTDNKGRKYLLNKAIEKSISIIISQTRKEGKILLIGNGASASISSHIATDFLKNAKIRASAFNDISLLTCISNDYGYEYVFQKPIEMFIEPKDVLIAISSSGKSKNILLGVKAAQKKKAKVITLSGFKSNNPLRKMGDINFYVPEQEYGFVEVVHTAICHCLVDNTKK